MKSTSITGRVIRIVLIQKRKDLTGTADIMWVDDRSCGAVRAIAGAQWILKQMQKTALQLTGPFATMMWHLGTTMLKSLQASVVTATAWNNCQTGISCHRWN